MIFEDYRKYFLVGFTVSSDRESNPISGLKARRWICCIRLIVLLILLDGGTQGCKKFVQIGPPNTEIVTADVFSNDGTATAATTAIYTQMFDNSEFFKIAQNLGLLADELTNHSTNETQLQFYTNAMTALNSSGEWIKAYNYIYQANAIIEGLENNSNITPAVVQQLTGEAKFIRAFWHFYLTNEYGNVPLVTTTLYTVNEKISRTPQAQVYTQIIQDLQDAQAELNSNYVDGSDTTVTTERVRPTKAAAEAMLARAYLYTGKYDSAEAQASLLIGNQIFSLCAINSAAPNAPFLANSTETIWQLETPVPSSFDTYDAQDFILVSAPSTGVDNSTSLSPQIMSAFEPGDLRRTYWVDSFQTSTTPIVTYYFPYKYQVHNTYDGNECTMVLRLAEQYLIRAEAEANLGDSSDAIIDLNWVRSRAGLLGYSTSVNGPLLNAILHERQVEFFTEWGHRWFDLIRTGTINTVMGTPGNVCQLKGGVWNSNSELYPIPRSEIVNDPNLTQNPGY